VPAKARRTQHYGGASATRQEKNGVGWSRKKRSYKTQGLCHSTHPGAKQLYIVRGRAR